MSFYFTGHAFGELGFILAIANLDWRNFPTIASVNSFLLARGVK